VCEPAAQPSHVVSPPRESSTRGPCNLCRARTEAPSARRAGKEPVPEYNSESDTVPGHASDSNPLSGFYSDSAYEFDFGSYPKDPESEDNTTEQPLSGSASRLVIASTPIGRFVYWPDHKPADLISGDSRYVAKSSWLLATRQDLQGRHKTGTLKTSPQTSCLLKHL
jgi:hypothetical protein